MLKLIYAKSETFVICQKWNIYRCLQFGVNSDVLFRENGDVITIKLNICQKWNIVWELDFCDMPTVIYAKSGTFVICQKWNIVWEWWRLFSENGDAITG